MFFRSRFFPRGASHPLRARQREPLPPRNGAGTALSKTASRSRKAGERPRGKCLRRGRGSSSRVPHVRTLARGRTFRTQCPRALYPARFRPRVLRDQRVRGFLLQMHRGLCPHRRGRDSVERSHAKHSVALDGEPKIHVGERPPSSSLERRGGAFYVLNFTPTEKPPFPQAGEGNLFKVTRGMGGTCGGAG